MEHRVKSRDLKSLVHLSNITFDAKQMSLAHIGRRERELRNRLSQLSAQEAAARAKINDDVLNRSGAILNWERWVATSRGRLNAELARLLAQREITKAELRKDFGRLQASKELLAKEEDRERRLSHRRKQV